MKLYRYNLWNFDQHNDKNNEDVFLNVNEAKKVFTSLHMAVVEDTYAVVPYGYLGKVINRLEIAKGQLVIQDRSILELYLPYKDDRYARIVFKDFFERCGYKTAAKAIAECPITKRFVATIYNMGQADKNFVKKMDKTFPGVIKYDETKFLEKYKSTVGRR